MSVKIMVNVFENEYNLGEVDFNFFTLSDLVSKMRKVCGIKVGSVEEMRIYVKLPAGNELCQINNYGELGRIIALLNYN